MVALSRSATDNFPVLRSRKSYTAPDFFSPNTFQLHAARKRARSHSLENIATPYTLLTASLLFNSTCLLRLWDPPGAFWNRTITPYLHRNNYNSGRFNAFTTTIPVLPGVEELQIRSTEPQRIEFFVWADEKRHSHQRTSDLALGKAAEQRNSLSIRTNTSATTKRCSASTRSSSQANFFDSPSNFEKV